MDRDWYQNLIKAFEDKAKTYDMRKTASDTNLKHLFGGLTIARVGVSNHAPDISKIVQKYGGTYSGFISSKVSNLNR